MKPMPSREVVTQTMLQLGEALLDVRMAGYAEPDIQALAKTSQRGLELLEQLRDLLYPEASA